MGTLYGRLSHEDPGVRLEALLEVGQLTDLTGRDALVQATVLRLADPHPGIRQAALDMLGKLCTQAGLRVSPEVVAQTITLTADARPGVRGQAAASLALVGLEHGEIDRTSPLVGLLDDPIPGVREEALAALGDLSAHPASDAIAGLLEDPVESVRFEAAFALASLEDERGRSVLEAALEDRHRRLDACEALKRMRSAQAVPALRALSKRWFLGWVDRLTLWATMFVLGDPSAQKRILGRANSRSRAERTYALSLIGSHRLTKGRAILERVARDSDDPLQDTAVRALGELGEPASLPVVEAVAQATSTSDELRDDALQAAEQIRRGRPSGT